METTKYLLHFRLSFFLCLVIFAFDSYSQQTWTQATSPTRGTQFYNSSGNLGYSVRTASGGGWAWQLVDGNLIPYFHVQFPTGFVGMGTDNPQSKLHINSTAPSIRLGNSSPAESFNGEVGSIAFWRHYDMFLSSKIYSTANYSIDQYAGADLRFATTPPNLFGAGGLPLTDRMTINSIGNIGIGTITPNAKLEVQNTSTLGTAPGSNQLLMRVSSLGGANYYMNNLWILRDNEPNSGWLSARLHDGISIDGSFLIPGTDTRTWWERSPFRDVQSWGNGNTTHMSLTEGNLGIGTKDTKGYKLAVVGKMISEEVVVKLQASWPDYVFEKSYQLLALKDVKAFIEQNKHLPEMPSAEEVQKNGVQLGEMNSLLLKKVEEMTLYLIEQQKQIEILKSEIAVIKNK